MASVASSSSMNQALENEGKLQATSTWLSERNGSNDILKSVCVHTDLEFSERIDDPLENFAEPDAWCQLSKPGKLEEKFCNILLKCAKNNAVTGLIVICDSHVGEVFGSATIGYVQTSRGTLIDEYDGTSTYGHLIDLRNSPLQELELRVFPPISQSTIALFGTHVYLKEIPAVPSYPRTTTLNLDTSPLAGGNVQNLLIPVNILCQKIDGLRTDLSSMEMRLKLHIDSELEKFKSEIFSRIDMLKIDKRGANVDDC